MGGKKAPPQPAPEPAVTEAKIVEEPAPMPIPDRNANANVDGSLGRSGAALSYAEQQAAKDEEEGRTGIGEANPRRPRPRDPAAVVNTAGTGLASSAVLTG